MVAPAIIAAGIGAGASLLGSGLSNRSARRSIEAQREQAQRAQEFIERSMRQSRGDAFRLYNEARAARQQGLQYGLTQQQQYVPELMNFYQQGNMAAQNQIINALPAMNAAILGQPMNYNPQAVGLQLPQFNVPIPQLQQISSPPTGPNGFAYQGTPPAQPAPQGLNMGDRG